MKFFDVDICLKIVVVCLYGCVLLLIVCFMLLSLIFVNLCMSLVVILWLLLSMFFGEWIYCYICEWEILVVVVFFIRLWIGM